MRSNDIDLRLLIEAVSKRPALYDKKHVHFFHTKYKERLWRETAQEVFPHLESMQPQSRIKRVRAVQKRWKNLRTCFTREIGLQRKEQRERNEGRIVKPRRIYGYFNKMKFLLGKDYQQTMQVPENYEYSEDNDDPLMKGFKTEYLEEEFEGEEELQRDDVEFERDESIKVVEAEQFRRQSVEVTNIDSPVNSRRKVNDYDEDKHFLLSLVNTLRKFNDKQKIEAKIEILQTLKKIQFADE